MSQDAAAAGPAKPAEESAQDGGEQKKQDGAAEGQEQRRQPAWAARQDLIAHAPDFVSTLVSGDQFGQTGGAHYGDKIFNIGGRAEAKRALSGPIPRTEIDHLVEVFRGSPSFDEASARLRDDRIVLLSGGRDTGRRAAALMLLHQLGIRQLRSLEPHTPFSALPDQLDTSAGYVLCDLSVSRNRPVREAQLFALREQLELTRAHLVITVEPSAALADIPSVRWEPPSPYDMLHAHVTPLTGEAAWAGLCGLTAVKEFLTRHHRPEEIKQFARRLIAHHRGEVEEEQLAAYGETAVATQVNRWLTEEKPGLRDKAFLISLAVFDKAPYAVTAELGDSLFVRLHKIDDPNVRPRIPVFGSSREERLRLARANGYATTEVTEWGPLEGKFCAAFRDERTPGMLLQEVWNLHPSARPALAEWIRELARDRRPLVRTRAASATAQLAEADLSSTMAHLVEPWADDDYFGSWLTAANALTMAELVGVPHVFQILHDWCTGEAESRRWTAVRAFGLLGPVNAEETLSALLDAIRRPASADADQDGEEEDEDDGSSEKEETRQFAEALELLLLAVTKPVLNALAEHLDKRRVGTDRAVRTHALLAFLQACRQPKGEKSDRPPVLDWYALATANGDTAMTRQLALFWQTLLADRAYNSQALGILRGWVRRADADPDVESALALLLPAVVSAPSNHRRVSHMLRSVRDLEGVLVPAAKRLLTLLDPA